MKLISFARAGQESYGTVTDSGVVDIGRRLGSSYGDLRALIAADAIDEARDIAHSADPDCALDAVTLGRPIPFPEKIVCIGVNYVNRNAEYHDESAQPKFPSVFMRTPDSLVGHQSPILRPPESEQLDYEGEIVLVIGKAGRRIPVDQAREHVAGLTIMNEGSVRDWLRHGKFNVTQGKNFAHSGAIGPWMVTTDEIADFDDMTVTTRVNGEVRQHDTTANLLFPFTYLIHYLSTFMILKPGDIIATGTPSGAGARFDPPKYLAAGDVVEVEVPGIGCLSNPVIDEETVE